MLENEHKQQLKKEKQTKLNLVQDLGQDLGQEVLVGEEEEGEEGEGAISGAR